MVVMDDNGFEWVLIRNDCSLIAIKIVVVEAGHPP